MKLLKVGFVAGALAVLSASAPRSMEAEESHLAPRVCAGGDLEVECEPKPNKKCCDRWLCLEDFQTKSEVIGTGD